MSNKEARLPVPFSVMNGDGESFVVGEKKYTIKPMLVGDALKFLDEGVSVGAQVFNLADKKMRNKLSGYISQYCTNETGEKMDLDKTVTDGWSLVDLKNFVRKLVDISG